MRRLILALPPLLALAGLFLAFGGDSGMAAPADPGAGGARQLVNAEAQRAIALGTRHLLRLQHADGSWHSNSGKKVNEFYRPFADGEDVPHVGVTALAVLSLLAGGHLPGRGPNGRAMDKGINFILSQVQPNGYISGNQTRMYSHAFATLALAEIYGVSRKERLRNFLQDAVEFTVNSQNETGGWRYVPLTTDSDMSITVCQVVALRAARNVGIKVPRQTIERALKYVIQSAITDSRHGPTGAFRYQPKDQTYNRSSFALCAAGLTTLFQAGLYDDAAVRRHIRTHNIDKPTPPSIQRSVQFMARRYNTVKQRHDKGEHYFFYYGNYYAAQAMYQIGGKEPKLWASWYEKVRDDLLKMKHPTRNPRTGAAEFFWRSNVDDTNAYATSCALLILQFPLDHLPIHQR